MEIESLILFFVAGIVLVGGGVVVSMLLAPKSSNKYKKDPYECGIDSIGSQGIQFRVGYYLFAILFLIFEVETVFVVPWATVMKEVGISAFIEILIFFFILGLGLLYAWKKGALKWD